MTEKLDMDRVVADKAWGLGLWVKTTPTATMSRYWHVDPHCRCVPGAKPLPKGEKR